MNKNDKEWFEVLNGYEVWTNLKRFKERVCVGIDGENYKICMGGKSYTLTKNEIKELQDDYNLQEYGTTDFKTIMKMEGF